MKYPVPYIWDTTWHPKICIPLFSVALVIGCFHLGIKRRDRILAMTISKYGN